MISSLAEIHKSQATKSGGGQLSNEQRLKLRELAGRLQINAGNAKSMGKLAAAALQNPSQYAKLRETAIRVGYHNIPEQFNARWLQSIVLLANSVLAGE